jgi:hypothetical protein
MRDDGSCPFPAPDTDVRHLRQIRFNEVGEHIERWIWEPADQAWRLESHRTSTEYEARRAELEAYQREHPITELDIGRAEELAKEIPDLPQSEDGDGAYGGDCMT